MKPKHWVRWVLIALAVIVVGIQLVPVDRDNPPVTAPLSAPPKVAAILERSCYNCHSNQTHWPWYSYVAPTSWIVAGDVHEARGHVNFSTWGSMSPRDQAFTRYDMWQQVDKGEMPLWMYTIAHPRAGLSSQDKQVLKAWCVPEGEAVTTAPAHHHEH